MICFGDVGQTGLLFGRAPLETLSSRPYTRVLRRLAVEVPSSTTVEPTNERPHVIFDPLTGS